MTKRPIARLVLFAAVVLLGLGLFFWLAPEAPVVARPADTELSP